MTRFVSLRAAGVLLVAVAVLILPERASAHERPHSSRGTAQFVSPIEFIGGGNATHLGAYSEVGRVSFSPTDDEDVLRIDGCAIYTAANGDQLYAVFTGRLNRETGEITATLTYVGGSGRFEDATGSAVLLGQILLDGTISVAVDGAIDY